MTALQVFLNKTSTKSHNLLTLLHCYKKYNINLLSSVFNHNGDYKNSYYMNEYFLDKKRFHLLNNAHCAIILKDDADKCDGYNQYELGYIKGKCPYLPLFIINQIDNKFNSSITNNLNDNTLYNNYNNDLIEIKDNLYNFLNLLGNNNNIPNVLENTISIPKIKEEKTPTIKFSYKDMMTNIPEQNEFLL